MRRFFVGVLMGLGLVVVQQSAQAIIRLTAPPEDPAKEFWIESRNLTQEQLRLLDRMEQSLTQTPDNQRLKILKGQVFLHLAQLDRFLKLNHPEPGEFCGAFTAGQLPGTDAVDPEQLKVFCSLYLSGRDVGAVRSYLDRQLNLSANSSAKISRTASRQTVQPATSNRVFLENTLSVIRSSRQRLIQTKAAFPIAFQPDYSEPVQTAEVSRYSGFTTEEWQPHADFLAQSDTGIARLVSGEVVVAANGQAAQGQTPFPVLAQRTTGLSPRLPLRVTGNLFQLMPMGMDYGFVADLGNVPLETLSLPTAEEAQAMPKLLSLFYTYRPPTQYEAVQTDRRRFLSGNASAFGLTQPVSNFISAHVGRTYLVRSIQYKLPETSAQSPQSSDVLVAIRPVNRRADGSYTILWRLLAQFPDPQIEGLEKTARQSKPAAIARRKG